jgi:hypothetical protein
MSGESKRAVAHTRGLAAQQREQREKHEASVRKLIGPPYEGTKKLVAKVRSGERVTSREILKELAIAKLASMPFQDEEKNVPIPVELLDAVAIKLAPEVVWQREQANASKARGKRETNKLQSAADSIWAAKPKLSATAVARHVAKRHGGNPNWIRRRIHRPK